MERIYPIFLSLLCCASIAQVSSKERTLLKNANVHVCFTENKGQFANQNYTPRPDVLFGGTDGQIAFHITAKGISYQLYKADTYKEIEDPKTKRRIKEVDQQTIYRTDIKWLNANPDPMIKTDEAISGYSNYYLEQCPNGALNVKSYTGVTLQNIYKNIDLHYYGKEGKLKYDYIVAPFADYKQIQLKIEGATLKLLKDGSLLIETPLGKIQEQAPIVYQNGKKLNAYYIVKSNIISFEVENYNSNYELIIDPVTRLWGTYYGGSMDEYGLSCTTDASSNVYMSGSTDSASGTVIATVGSHQSTYSGNGFDAFLVKLNSSGVRLWATYYGGTGGDNGYSTAVDASGNVFMAGLTSSTLSSVIATAGSHQIAYGGGIDDAFLVKFNSSGVRQWGTYYGGVLGDEGFTCATDPSGNVFLHGLTQTASGTAIATVGSHQDTYGGSVDAFLVKFDGSGARQWGTYYGGSANEGASFDNHNYCVTDISGNVYIVGTTQSSVGTVIASIGSHQSVYGGGVADGYLAKFNSSGLRLWATYYGGNGDDGMTSCTIDAFSDVYVTGEAESNNGTVIATPGSHQSLLSGPTGESDAFLVKFNSNGSRIWGTYYGGAGSYDHVTSCATDPAGNVYMAGVTDYSVGTVIVTLGSHQPIYGGGNKEAYIVKFNGIGVRQSGTYYGGNLNDYATSCAVDASGNVFLSGHTQTGSGTVIASSGSHQTLFGGTVQDAFLVKFAGCNGPNQPSVISGSVTACSGSSQIYSVTNDPIATSYAWSLPLGWSGSSSSNTILAVVGTTGILTVTAINPCGPSPQQTLNISVNPSPTISANTSNTLICLGQLAILTASGATNYTWNPGASNGASISVSPSATTVYTVTGTFTNGCLSTTTVSQMAVDCTSLLEADNEGAGVIIYPNPSNGVFKVELANKNDKGVFIIVNNLGEQIFEKKMSSGKNKIDASQVPAGLYHYMFIRDKEHMISGKLMIFN